MKTKYQSDSSVIGLIGILLFVLVLLIIYLAFLISLNLGEGYKLDIEGLVPLVIFSGFFTFLVGAVLLGLSLFKAFGGFNTLNN